jgi:hypothetical protein
MNFRAETLKRACDYEDKFFNVWRLKPETNLAPTRRVPSSGIWRCAVRWKPTDVSGEHVSSIFRAEEQAKQESRVNQAANMHQRLCRQLKVTVKLRLLPVSCFAYFSTLKTEATRSSEMSADLERTSRRYIPEAKILHNHRCENLTPNKAPIRGRADEFGFIKKTINYGL